MSVRIHQLSKQIGMENKELLELLKERGFEVKSASSTIDNISAESIVEEFTSTEKAEEAAPEAEASTEPEKPKAPQLPAGAIVKSAADIEKERKAKLEAKEEAAKPKDAAPAKAPTPPAPQVAVKPPAPAGPPKPPTPAGPPKPAASKPAGPPKASAPAPAGPPKAPGLTAPAPVSSPKPPAVAVSPKQPTAPAPAGPPKPPSAPTPAGPPKPPSSTAEATVEATDAPEEGTEGAVVAASAGAKIIHVKPPIVVRDFAGELGLKPFKLISELMEMGIFASMV